MQVKETKLVELRADEGKILVNKEGYGATLIYLGIYDSADNYTEINIEDYVEPVVEEPVPEIPEEPIPEDPEI